MTVFRQTKQLARVIILLKLTEFIYTITRRYDTSKAKKSIYDKFTRLIFAQQFRFEALFKIIKRRFRIKIIIVFLSTGRHPFNNNNLWVTLVSDTCVFFFWPLDVAQEYDAWLVGKAACFTAKILLIPYGCILHTEMYVNLCVYSILQNQAELLNPNHVTEITHAVASLIINFSVPYACCTLIV